MPIMNKLKNIYIRAGQTMTRLKADYRLYTQLYYPSVTAELKQISKLFLFLNKLT